MIKVHRINGGVYFEFTDHKLDRLNFSKRSGIKIIKIHGVTIPLILKEYFINNRKGKESYYFSRMKELNLYYDLDRDIIRTKLINEDFNAEYTYNPTTQQKSYIEPFDNELIEPINTDLITKLENEIEYNSNQIMELKKQIDNQQTTIDYIYSVLTTLINTAGSIPAVVGSPLNPALLSELTTLQLNKQDFTNKNTDIKNNIDSNNEDYENKLNITIDILQEK